MRKSRLAWPIQKRLIEHFVAGTTARCASALISISHKKLFVDKGNHTKGINSWNQAKRHMKKYYGRAFSSIFEEV